MSSRAHPAGHRAAGRATGAANPRDLDDLDGLHDLDEFEAVLKALASTRRLEILRWLKDPLRHFPPQEHGDPIEHGTCNLFIVGKLGVSQPAASRHLKVLLDAGLIVATRRRGWTYYRRNEAAIESVTARVARI